MQHASPLPVIATLRGALEAALGNRSALLRTVVVLSFALAICDFLDEYLGAVGFLFALLWLAPFTLLAVSCHRVFLLGESALPNRWGLFWSARELRFVGWFVVVSLTFLAAILVIRIPLSMLTGIAAPDSPLFGELSLAYWSLVPLGAYVFFRASLVFPACAIGERLSMARAWSLSDGNGWRLTLALSIPMLAVSFLLGLPEMVGVKLEASPVLIPLNAAFYALGVVEIAALSLAYRHFVSCRETTSWR